MTNQELINIFNQHCCLWLDDEAPDDFSLDGVDFTLESSGKDMIVYCEGVEVARTDIRRDFMNIGTYLLAAAK